MPFKHTRRWEGEEEIPEPVKEKRGEKEGKKKKKKGGASWVPFEDYSREEGGDEGSPAPDHRDPERICSSSCLRGPREKGGRTPCLAELGQKGRGR